MNPKTSLALAIALPLAFLCVAILAGSVAILHQSYRRQCWLDEERVQAKYHLSQTQEKLAAFPKIGGPDPHRNFSDHDIYDAYFSFTMGLERYFDRWVYNDKHLHLGEELAARIQRLLFSRFKLSPDDEKAGKSDRKFPNPHHYTAEEILSEFVAGGDRRTRMFAHISASVMLNLVMLDGPSSWSMLPFKREEVHSLYKLHKELPTLRLNDRVLCHIANYWIWKSDPSTTPETQSEGFCRTLIESLCEPYYSDEVDKFEQFKQLKKVISLAVEFGKRVSGHSMGHVELRWGERLADMSRMTLRSPAVYSVRYLKREGEKPREHMIAPGGDWD